MIFIDYDTAVSLTKSLSPNATEPMLTIELEATKGLRYRPYYVAAKFMMIEYRRIVKADEVTFAYNLDAIRSLLNIQSGFDLDDTAIPIGQTVDDLKASLCDTCETDTVSEGLIGVNLY